MSNLNLKLLPWNSNRDEGMEANIHTVIHKNDPDCTWYRPRRVLVLETNMRSLERYLGDQERYRQYTQEDMMVRLGYHAADWLRLFRSSKLSNMNTCTSPAKGQNNENNGQKVLSPLSFHLDVTYVLLANLHLCYNYKNITYIPDELSDDDMNPYILLMRSGDCNEKPISTLAKANDELRKMRQQDIQRQILYREVELRDQARKRFAKLRSAGQSEADTEAKIPNPDSERVILTTKPKKTKRNYIFRVFTAPFRWLRKHL